ncbi:SPOSA6832_01148 [Sporobolomyces salmonicolor]|uniref:Elongation factor 1 alpha-like protein n=1 Tax=Sporidiobolus salmonicolor TaxID=5005 RepID=A0A0D6EHU6_SPOSA|nr:SPOSA6832_01148 [Sporobolomyces salmonicolor]
MAANRAAKAAAAAASTTLAPAPAPSITPTPTTTVPSLAPTSAPEKKLSKLQQKMASARAARSTASTPAPAPLPEPTPAPPPLPAGPVLLEPVSELFAPSHLAAAPSSFASVFIPSERPPLEPVAKRIASTLAVGVGAVGLSMTERFGPSPDDRVLEARTGTALGAKARLAKQARKAAATQPLAARASTPAASTSSIGPKKAVPAGSVSGATARPAAAGSVSQMSADMEGMGLGERKNLVGTTADEDDELQAEEEGPPPAMSMAKEKILEEVRAKEKDEKPVLSLVVVGHVDAGKSTLMGRVLHDLGETADKTVENFQRQSAKIGKASFAYAWTFDAMEEERERGVTIDVAIDSFATQHKRFTLIDAPGHRDFIPNMISGAAQADTAVLVVDGSSGAFERGFEGGGQTREHAVLVRSLGVQQLIVAVNKLDAVGWAQSRFEAIRDQLQPFLTQSGFHPSKVSFVPVGAMSGENLVKRSNEILKAWYEGPTLVEQLAPLRIPVSNVFKGQSATASGLAVSGRIESGIVQVGEKLAALPGDETGVVRALEVDGELVPYAIAGVNATVFLSGIDSLQLNIGSVLCPTSQLVPVVSSFTAQIMVFEPKYPITAGYAVELFHHSRDLPATIASLDAQLDKASGEVVKLKPRMLTKGTSARVHVQLRPSAAGRSAAIPIEPFSVNKSMGRVLFRRNGETVAAGIILETLQ